MIFRCKAPLRLCFSGEGTDVPPFPEEHDGVVLSTAIDKFVFGTLKPTQEKSIEVKSLDYDIVAKYTTDKDLKYNGDLDLVKAAIKHLKADSGMYNIYLHSDAPPGSGLGSSSATAVAVVCLLKEWQNKPMTDYELAEVAYKVEREEVKIKGGKQDHYVTIFGGFNFIEFVGDKIIVNPLKIDMSTINELQYHLLLCYTGQNKLMGNIIDQQLQNYNDNIDTLERIKDITHEIKNKLLTNNLDQFGELLDESWKYKKQLAKDITNDQIDKLYDIAKKHGAVGGKIMGAGGGGFMLFYCEFDKKHNVAEELEKHGAQIAEFDFELRGIQSWQTV
ncbi:MAG: GHMP kinase [Thermoplasmata archaeon]|nr:MAG: GHMP kinase [Thermoplasmata archaeon]